MHTSKTIKNFFSFLMLIVLTLGLSISFQSLLAAWTAPTQDPPGGNLYAPIYSSIGTAQGIQSDLGIGGNFLVDKDDYVFFVDSFNDKVGIGTVSPSETLDVVGNVIVSGDISANSLVNTSVCPDGNCDILNNEGVTSDGIGASNIYAGSDIEIDFQDNVNMNGFRMIGMQVPAEDDEAATKGYVDGNIKYSNCGWEDGKECSADKLMSGYNALQVKCCGVTGATCTFVNWMEYDSYCQSVDCYNPWNKCLNVNSVLVSKQKRINTNCLVDYKEEVTATVCQINCWIVGQCGG